MWSSHRWALETPSLRHTGIDAVLFATNSIVGRRRQLQVRHRFLGNIQASLSENGWCAWEEFNHGWNKYTTNTCICIDNDTVITHAHTDTHTDTRTRIVLHYKKLHCINIALILHYISLHCIAHSIALHTCSFMCSHSIQLTCTQCISGATCSLLGCSDCAGDPASRWSMSMYCL